MKIMTAQEAKNKASTFLYYKTIFKHALTRLKSYAVMTGILSLRSRNDLQAHSHTKWLVESYRKKHADIYTNNVALFNGSILTKYEHHFEGFCSSIFDEADEIAIRDFGAGTGTGLRPVPGGWLDRCIRAGRYFPQDVAGTNPTAPSTSDVVICTDVLEHIHFRDLGRFMGELFQAGDNIFMSISCRISHAKFESGIPCHISIFRPDFWIGMAQGIGVNKNFCIVFEEPTLWGGCREWVWTFRRNESSHLQWSTSDFKNCSRS